MLTPTNELYSRNRGNQAVNVNSPYSVDFHITSHGSSWYWSVFSLLGACIIGMLCWAWLGRKPHQRLFHYITLYALIVLAYQYFTMASNLGWVPIQAEFSHVWIDHTIQSTQPGMRQIFYVRWVAYFIAFPAYLLNWAALVGLPWSAALFTVGAQEIMVVSFLIASLVKTSYKWGYYTFGVLALLLVIYNLWKEYLVAAYELDSIKELLSGNASLSSTLWPHSCCCFILSLSGLSEGGNVIQPDSETIFYGILISVFRRSRRLFPFRCLQSRFWQTRVYLFEQTSLCSCQQRGYATTAARTCKIGNSWPRRAKCWKGSLSSSNSWIGKE